MYDVGDFKAECPSKRTDCKDYCVDCNRGNIVKTALDLFVTTAHLNFDKPFDLSVLGHKVFYKRGEVAVECTVDGHRILEWKVGSSVELPDDEVSDIDIYSVLKAASVVLVRKYAPFKTLIGPCRVLVPRLSELDLVKQLIDSVNEKAIEHSFSTNGESLLDYVSKIVPIGNIESNFEGLKNQGCLVKDMTETSKVLRQAAHINHCNADMVRKIFSITGKVMVYVKSVKNADDKLKKRKSFDNDKLQSSNEWVRFEDDKIRDKYGAYDWDFDGQLASVEFIDDFVKTVAHFTDSDNYICTFSEIYKRLTEETGLSDAVKGYRAIRRRYKKDS